MFKRLYIVLLVFIIFGVLLFSQEQQKKLNLDIDTAVSLALANNLDIKSEKIKFENAQWSAFTSWNAFIPSVSVGTTLARSYVDDYLRMKVDPKAVTIGPPLVPKKQDMHLSETKSIWDLSALFNLSINFNAGMVFKVYQAALDYKNSKINLESAKNTVINSVKKNFYSLILLQKQISLVKDNIAILEKRYNEALSDYKKGYKSEFNYLSARADYENAKPDLMIKQSDYENALLQFKQLVGLKSDVMIVFTGKIETGRKDLDPEELVTKYLADNLAYQSAKLSVDASRNMMNAAISSFTPTFGIGLLFDPDFQNDPLASNWFGDQKYMTDNWKYQRSALSFTLTMPVDSLFPFSQQQVNVIKYRNMIENSRVMLQNVGEKLSVQVKSLVNDLEKNSATIDAYKKNIKFMQLARDKAEEFYRQGTMELLDLQVEENKLENAKFSLLYAEYLYKVDMLDLENILNTKLN